jgi:hypothetical protein
MRLTWEVSGGDRHLKFYEVRDNLRDAFMLEKRDAARSVVGWQ